MSKKETEFDRIDRMRKMEKEAEITKRKNSEEDLSKKKGAGKPKVNTASPKKKNWTKDYDDAMGDEYEYINS